MKPIETLQQWHQIVKAGDSARLDELLAADCVFHSPVVHTPQRGRELTRLYLTGAMHVLNDNFRYVREVVGERDAVLEFLCEIDGIEVNGVDIMRFDNEGRICEFKVMLRPLKAINTVHERMRQMLERLQA